MRAGHIRGSAGSVVWRLTTLLGMVKTMSRVGSWRGGRAALKCPSLPGAGAKQEPRLFRDLPDLLSTAANRPVMGRGFSVSAGQQIVEITLGVK
jgi:hypothetical protein